MNITIIKRDGRKVAFDQSKIFNAISKANKDSLINIEELTNEVVSKLTKSEISVEEIQDLVEQTLVSHNFFNTAKSYILYRNERNKARDLGSTLIQTVSDMFDKEATEMDSKRENANIDGNAPMGIMLQIGSELSKKYALDYSIKSEQAQAHINGDMHIHDLNFYDITLNCCQIPAGKLLKQGFLTGHGFIRSPNNINTAAALICIILQSNQNECFGGQSIPMFEYDLAPYVAKSFIKNILELMDYEVSIENPEELKQLLWAFYKAKGTILPYSNRINDVKDWLGTSLTPSLGSNKLDKILRKAHELTEKQTYQAMEAVIHNLNTMASRAGAQVPFSSINYGTGTKEEERLIIRCILEATDKGLGNGETPIFPVQVFKLLDGVNTKPEDPNYDLFELSCKVSAKRLFPNYVFLNAPFNKKYIKKEHPETELAVMGCFTKGHSIKVLNTKTYQLSKVEISDFVENYNYKDYRVWDSLEGSYVEILNVINNPETRNFYQVKYDNNLVLTVTEDHYFPLVFKGRTNVKDIVPGDMLYRASMVKATEHSAAYIQEVKKLGIQAKSYCLETASDHFDVNNVVTNNCRTRVIGNNYDPENEVSVGRGNLAFTTINLPRIGILSNHNLDDFFKRLDRMMDLARDNLLDRFYLLSKKHVYNFPFLMGQGVWLGSEKLKPEDTIEEVIKHGTLAIGFIGLAECLVALIGKHHGESEEAQQLGLKIITHMRDYCDRVAKETGLTFALFATPAEGLCLAGDTLVQTNLGNLPIKDIKEGTLVLTFNETTREKEFKRVLKSGMTFSKASVMKISFDDGSSVVCTPNHPFMVRVGMYRDDENGQFCTVKGTNEILDWYRADELKVGMRIKSDEIFTKETGHLKIRNGKTIHRMVWEYYNGEIPEGYVIHHKDENKLNNSIDNLQLLTRKEHKILHMKDTILSHCFTHESVLGEKNPFFGKTHSKESKDKISFTKRLANNKKKLSDVDLINLFYSGNTCEEIAAQFKAKPDVIKHRLFNELNVSSEKNHIVTSIEYLEKEQPVYDLTVEDNHNFFVGGNRGILVHNSGRFTKIDRKKFGKIKGVTDREFYTNSSHIPVYYPISAAKKIELEAPYHELCSAGHIAYVECEGDISKNIEAFKNIILYMDKCGITYGSINHPVDRCPVCGYVGIINDTCPKCGRHECEPVSIEKLKSLGCTC